jgi:hypothetical protein
MLYATLAASAATDTSTTQLAAPLSLGAAALPTFKTLTVLHAPLARRTDARIETCLPLALALRLGTGALLCHLPVAMLFSSCLVCLYEHCSSW